MAPVRAASVTGRGRGAGECAGRWSGAPGGEVERRGEKEGTAPGCGGGRRPARGGWGRGLEVGEAPDRAGPPVGG
jgi:hypothetical protein